MAKREKGIVRCAILALLAAATLLAGRVDAANGNPGRTAYFRYCSSCHGDDGRGDGVAAASFRHKPPDLTQLAKKHGGKFPAREVAEIIEGRKRIAAHGSSTMPVWGTVFAEEKSYESPEGHAQTQVQLLTSYLASIQTQ